MTRQERKILKGLIAIAEGRGDLLIACRLGDHRRAEKGLSKLMNAGDADEVVASAKAWLSGATTDKGPEERCPTCAYGQVNEDGELVCSRLAIHFHTEGAMAAFYCADYDSAAREEEE